MPASSIDLLSAAGEDVAEFGDVAGRLFAGGGGLVGLVEGLGDGPLGGVVDFAADPSLVAVVEPAGEGAVVAGLGLFGVAAGGVGQLRGGFSWVGGVEACLLPGCGCGLTVCGGVGGAGVLGAEVLPVVEEVGGLVDLGLGEAVEGAGGVAGGDGCGGCGFCLAGACDFGCFDDSAVVAVGAGGGLDVCGGVCGGGGVVVVGGVVVGFGREVFGAVPGAPVLGVVVDAGLGLGLGLGHGVLLGVSGGLAAAFVAEDGADVSGGAADGGEAERDQVGLLAAVVVAACLDGDEAGPGEAGVGALHGAAVTSGPLGCGGDGWPAYRLGVAVVHVGGVRVDGEDGAGGHVEPVGGCGGLTSGNGGNHRDSPGVRRLVRTVYADGRSPPSWRVRRLRASRPACSSDRAARSTVRRVTPMMADRLLRAQMVTRPASVSSPVTMSTTSSMRAVGARPCTARASSRSSWVSSIMPRS
nr:MAG TPA: hypothetical protein [Caudoviricetes sp.]